MPSLPLWAIPGLLAVLALVWVVGRLSTGVAAIASLAAAVAIAYLPLSRRLRREKSGPPAGLLAMLPGHLLLLLALSWAPTSDGLALVWAALPVISVIYDVLWFRWRGRALASILGGLYAILWCVVLVLLERVIARSKGISGLEEAPVAVAFGVIAVVFVVTGVVRHRRAGKES